MIMNWSFIFTPPRRPPRLSVSTLVTFLLLTANEGRNTVAAVKDPADYPADDDVTKSLLVDIQQAHPLWLRERCLESFYVDPDTRQPRINLHDEVEDLTVTGIEEKVKGRSNNDNEEEKSGYVVTFSDGQSCFYDETILRAEFHNDVTFLQTTEWFFPPENLWDKSLLAPSVFEHDEIIGETDQTRKFLSTVISTGLVVVNNVPRVEGECARFGQKFTTVRDTEWGLNFNVRTQPDLNNGSERKDLAYTSHSIGMHIDSPYRIDTPPSYQLLHAIEHCNGSECFVHNTFVDGFKVANDLCKSNREYFDILASTVLRWENNGGDDSSFLVRKAPIIEIENEGMMNANTGTSTGCPRVAAINFSAKSGGYAPHLPVDLLERFYQAKRTFSSMLHSEDYTVRLQLYPGALVMFDNRRVLHSRSAIAPSDGARWLQGCYFNRDGIFYNYERMRRKWSKKLTETPFRNLREAAKSDFDRMGREYDQEVVKRTVSNLIDILTSQKGSYLGQPVSLFEHGLQTASRALRGGEDDETVVMSLFHDMFETLAVKNHGELVASMLAPWISPQSQWVLAHHEIFQGYYYFGHYGIDRNTRDMFVDHPFYNWTVTWCEKYDQASFDPDYPTLGLSYFLPIVERVLSRNQYWWNPSHPKAGAVSASDHDNNETTSYGSDSINTTDTTAASSKATKAVLCEETWTCYGDLDIKYHTVYTEG